jgi:hypothetical protein
MAPMTSGEAITYCKSRGEGPLNNVDKFVRCVSSATTKNLSSYNTSSKVNIRGNPLSRKNRKSRRNRNRKNRKGTRRN